MPGSFGLPDLTDVDLSVQRIGKLILIQSEFDKILSLMTGFIFEFVPGGSGEQSSGRVDIRERRTLSVYNFINFPDYQCWLSN